MAAGLMVLVAGMFTLPPHGPGYVAVLTIGLGLIAVGAVLTSLGTTWRTK